MKQALVRFMLKVRHSFDRAGIPPPLWLVRVGRALYLRWAPPPSPVFPVGLPSAITHADLATLQAELVQVNVRLDQISALAERLETTLYLMRVQQS